jgi:hypothetical protein
MLEMINQDEDMKISFKCNAAHQLLLGLSLTNIAPNMIWVCLFIWLSFFEHHCPQLTDSSFNHLPLPPSWFEYCLFSFSRSTVLPQVVNLSRSLEKCWCHFCQGFCKFNRCSSCLTNLPCSGIKSHLSKIMSIQVLLKWNQRDVNFWKDLLKIKLFDQRPNTRYSKYTVLWLSCILKTELDPL